MSAKILDGRKVRDSLKADLVAKIGRFKSQNDFPALAIIQVGDRADTNAYVNAKKRFAADIGIEVRHIRLPDSVTAETLVSNIRELNADTSVGGVIVQFPLPERLDDRKSDIISAIDGPKDVDAITGKNDMWPATARGVEELFDFYHISLARKKVCVVGRSALVGAPIAEMCRSKGAEVTVCHSKTADIGRETLAADVIISAVGRAGLITANMVRPGQVVVDVGINAVERTPVPGAMPVGSADGKVISAQSGAQPGRKLVGDADFEAVSRVLGDSGAITPVPGGVGPMTVLGLFENLADLCGAD